jgi:transposase-like protein
MDAQATFSCSFTQSDLDPVVELPSLPRWPAQRLLPQERRDLAIQVLAGAQPVSDLAREHEVSRKFLYQQAQTAQDALIRAFDPEPKTEKVLFYLPVTKACPVARVDRFKRPSSGLKPAEEPPDALAPQSARDAAPLCNGPDRSAKSRGVIDGCSESARCVIILS